MRSLQPFPVLRSFGVFNNNNDEFIQRYFDCYPIALYNNFKNVKRVGRLFVSIKKHRWKKQRRQTYKRYVGVDSAWTSVFYLTQFQFFLSSTRHFCQLWSWMCCSSVWVFLTVVKSGLNFFLKMGPQTLLEIEQCFIKNCPEVFFF